MSSLIVEVCQVDAVEKHPNADRLAIAKVKGWHTCISRDPITGKTKFEPGDKCVYFPPDSVLPIELSDRLGVTKYLGNLSKQEDGTQSLRKRVKVANLRGFKSYGLIFTCENPEWKVGTNVAEYYGVSKWEPPLLTTDGDSDRPCAAFHSYYDMENIRNFPNLFVDGEEVVVTEKIHGQNTRLALIRDTNEQGKAVWKWMAGSHGVRRKRFYQKHDREGHLIGDPIESSFWQCFNEANRRLLCDLSQCDYSPEEIDAGAFVKNKDCFNIVLFGERYGSGVQDMWYGFSNGQFGFRAFDVTINGKYLNYDEKMKKFQSHGVETVQLIYRGPFNFAKIEELSEGPTTMCETHLAGRFKGREGIVILPIQERQVIAYEKVFERLQLKCISFDYLNRKDGTEQH